MGFWKKLKKKVKAAQKNTVRFLDKAGAKNVTTQFNIKKLVTNPKDYFKKNYEAFKKDGIHAVGVYKDWVTGNWSKLGEQGTAETREALGMKKDKKQEKQAAALGEAYENYDKGDYGGAAKALEGGDLGLVSTVAGKAAPAAKYVGLASDLYSDAQTGGPEGRARALEHIEQADIKYVSDAAGYARTGAEALDAYEKGGAKAALTVAQEADIRFVSDAAGGAKSGVREYEKATSGGGLGSILDAIFGKAAS